MFGLTFRSGAALLGLSIAACSPAPQVTPGSTTIPGEATRQIVRERLSAVVVTSRKELGSWVNARFSISDAPGDADGGSAAPITGDGYFLTADHVLARSDGKNVFIVYGGGRGIVTAKARIVWRSKADDLALLHIPRETPYFYRWTPAGEWLSRAIGSSTAAWRQAPAPHPAGSWTALPPEGAFTRNRPFKIDIPLQPGDSGGPVVDAFGKLVGINSAVEFIVPLETAIFIDSEGNRPNTAKIAEIIRQDRESR